MRVAEPFISYLLLYLPPCVWSVLGVIHDACMSEGVRET